MGINPVKVLLVGEGARNSLQLLQWLSYRGCSCQVAQSCRDACNLVSRTQFDLVLSQYQLPDRTAFPLVDRLAGSPATLFFSTRVESGSLWLKMLEQGKRCIAAPVLQSNALIQARLPPVHSRVQPEDRVCRARPEVPGECAGAPVCLHGVAGSDPGRAYPGPPVPQRGSHRGFVSRRALCSPGLRLALEPDGQDVGAE